MLAAKNSDPVLHNTHLFLHQGLATREYDQTAAIGFRDRIGDANSVGGVR